MFGALSPLPYIMNMLLVPFLHVLVLHRIIFRETFYTVTVIPTLNVAITSICMQIFPLSVESLISYCDLFSEISSRAVFASWHNCCSYHHGCHFHRLQTLRHFLTWCRVTCCLCHYHHISTYPVNSTDCCAIYCMLPLLQVIHHTRKYSACTT
jgi:hypothetical protein